MICPRKGIFRALLDGELEPRHEERLRRHLEGCGKCRLKLDQAKADREWLVKTIGFLDAPEPGALPTLELHGEEWVKPRRLSFWQRPVPVPVPVLLLLFAVCIFLAGSLFRQSHRLKSLQSSPSAASGQATMVLTMPGMRQTVNLGIDPSRLQVMSEPQVFVVKEEGNDKEI